MKEMIDLVAYRAAYSVAVAVTKPACVRVYKAINDGYTTAAQISEVTGLSKSQISTTANFLSAFGAVSATGCDERYKIWALGKKDFSAILEILPFYERYVADLQSVRPLNAHFEVAYYLCNSPEQTVKEVAAHFAITYQAANDSLKKLVEIGVAAKSTKNQKVAYFAEVERFEKLEKIAKKTLRTWENV